MHNFSMTEEFDGDALRVWRKGRGLRREDIAAACHVSAVAVHNWESGRNKPHAALVPMLTGMMAGEIAIFPLTGVEEYFLDQCVKQGEFTNREDFLTSALLKVVSGGLKPFRGVVPEEAESGLHLTGSSPAFNPLQSVKLGRVAEEPQSEGHAYTPQKEGTA